MLPQTSSTSSMTVEPVPPSQCRYSPHPRYPQGCLRSYRKPDEAAASATEVSPTPPNMAITTEPATNARHATRRYPSFDIPSSNPDPLSCPESGLQASAPRSANGA